MPSLENWKEATQLRCPNCGHDYTPVALFCMKCGKVVAPIARIVDYDGLQRVAGNVSARLAAATKTVFISGIDLKLVAESSSADLEAALQRGLKVKILAVSPKGSIPGMVHRLFPRFPTPASFRKSMVSLGGVLRRLKKIYPKFEFRYLPLVPSIGFFMCDVGLRTEFVKIELYTAKPYAPINSRPHLLLEEAGADWREYFLNQWKNYWALGDPAPF